MNKMLFLSFASATFLLGTLPGCLDQQKAAKPAHSHKEQPQPVAPQDDQQQDNRNQFGIELEPGETIVSVEKQETKQVLVPENNAKF